VNDPFALTGRVAIVTGGNGGIGLGMAQGLAAAGARVVIAARNAEKSHAALCSLGPRALAIEADVSDPGAVARRVERTVAACGGLDILVNDAGIKSASHRTSFPSSHGIGCATPISRRRSRARVPSTPGCADGAAARSSTWARLTSLFGAAWAPAYAASKGGLVQFTKAWASAWAKDNIQVNAVLPGWIDTALTRRGREEALGLHERVLERTPAGRWGGARRSRGGCRIPCERRRRLHHGDGHPRGRRRLYSRLSWG